MICLQLHANECCLIQPGEILGMQTFFSEAEKLQVHISPAGRPQPNFVLARQHKTYRIKNLASAGMVMPRSFIFYPWTYVFLVVEAVPPLLQSHHPPPPHLGEAQS